MQATSNLNRQAKSKSQNPLIKQRKIEEVKPPQRWQWQAKSVLASERALARMRSDRASAWVWRGLRWGWDSRGLQVGLGFPFDMLGLILGLISIDFCWFWLFYWVGLDFPLILALIFYWICDWIFMCCKMVVGGCVCWVVVGRWLIGCADEERACEMKKKKKREEEGI